MKLRTKIFLVFSFLAITPLLILTGFSYMRYTQSIYQRMDDFSARLFENATETANNTLDGIARTTSLFHFYYSDGSTVIPNLELFSVPDTRPEIYEYYQASQEFNRACLSHLYADDYLYGIYVITPSGYIFSCTNEQNGILNKDTDFERMPWYKKTKELNGRLYISTVDTHALFTGQKHSVFFAQYLSDVYTHKPLGVLLIDCNPEVFDLSAVNSMPDITLLTIDDKTTNGVLYTNYDKITSTFTDENRKVMQCDLALSPLRLTAVVDYSSLFREFNLTLVLMILMALVCIANFLIIAYFVSYRLVRPLEELSGQMASQKGHSLELSTRYLSRMDEVGTLYNGYNTMAESLNAAIKQDYHDKLVVLDAQMKSLEARINSHFLFNTLESINSMAELEDNDQIATMSLCLGNMFRYTLKTQSELVTVNEELGNVQDYISIQQIRFDYRFRLVIDMTEEFKNQKILKLILQPLVENALYHGLKYCTCGDLITITGKAESSYLYIDVLDNGQGMKTSQIIALQKTLREEASFTELGHRNKQSIGLKNIHSRIELYYGHGYGLSITSDFGNWTNIRIKLPVMK